MGYVVVLALLRRGLRKGCAASSGLGLGDPVAARMARAHQGGVVVQATAGRWRGRRSVRSERRRVGGVRTALRAFRPPAPSVMRRRSPPAAITGQPLSPGVAFHANGSRKWL